ncbi:MAG: hypothetical protein Q9159_000844 [Coniocarpon cinnabarinum]
MRFPNIFGLRSTGNPRARTPSSQAAAADTALSMSIPAISFTPINVQRKEEHDRDDQPSNDHGPPDALAGSQLPPHEGESQAFANSTPSVAQAPPWSFSTPDVTTRTSQNSDNTRKRTQSEAFSTPAEAVGGAGEVDLEESGMDSTQSKRAKLSEPVIDGKHSIRDSTGKFTSKTNISYSGKPLQDTTPAPSASPSTQSHTIEHRLTSTVPGQDGLSSFQSNDDQRSASRDAADPAQSVSSRQSSVHPTDPWQKFRMSAPPKTHDTMSQAKTSTPGNKHDKRDSSGRFTSYQTPKPKTHQVRNQKGQFAPLGGNATAPPRDRKKSLHENLNATRSSPLRAKSGKDMFSVPSSNSVQVRIGFSPTENASQHDSTLTTFKSSDMTGQRSNSGILSEIAQESQIPSNDSAPNLGVSQEAGLDGETDQNEDSMNGVSDQLSNAQVSPETEDRHGSSHFHSQQAPGEGGDHGTGAQQAVGRPTRHGLPKPTVLSSVDAAIIAFIYSGLGMEAFALGRLRQASHGDDIAAQLLRNLLSEDLESVSSKSELKSILSRFDVAQRQKWNTTLAVACALAMESARDSEADVSENAGQDEVASETTNLHSQKILSRQTSSERAAGPQEQRPPPSTKVSTEVSVDASTGANEAASPPPPPRIETSTRPKRAARERAETKFAARPFAFLDDLEVDKVQEPKVMRKPTSPAPLRQGSSASKPVQRQDLSKDDGSDSWHLGSAKDERAPNVYENVNVPSRLSSVHACGRPGSKRSGRPLQQKQIDDLSPSQDVLMQIMHSNSPKVPISDEAQPDQAFTQVQARAGSRQLDHSTSSSDNFAQTTSPLINGKPLNFTDVGKSAADLQATPDRSGSSSPAQLHVEKSAVPFHDRSAPKKSSQTRRRKRRNRKHRTPSSQHVHKLSQTNQISESPPPQRNMSHAMSQKLSQMQKSDTNTGEALSRRERKEWRRLKQLSLASQSRAGRNSRAKNVAQQPLPTFDPPSNAPRGHKRKQDKNHRREDKRTRKARQRLRMEEEERLVSTMPARIDESDSDIDERVPRQRGRSLSVELG